MHQHFFSQHSTLNVNSFELLTIQTTGVIKLKPWRQWCCTIVPSPHIVDLFSKDFKFLNGTSFLSKWYEMWNQKIKPLLCTTFLSNTIGDIDVYQQTTHLIITMELSTIIVSSFHLSMPAWIYSLLLFAYVHHPCEKIKFIKFIIIHLYTIYPFLFDVF